MDNLDKFEDEILMYKECLMYCEDADKYIQNKINKIKESINIILMDKEKNFKD